jgi:hypothetical protein
MSSSLAQLENSMASVRAAKADAEREIAVFHDRRKKLLLSGDIDAIEEIDRQIRRHGIEAEVADAKAGALRGDIYIAREEARRWAGVTMPTDDELAKLLDIVAAAHPGEFRYNLNEFRRAFFACGRLGRLSEPSTDRYFVSSLDDANEILRAHRLESVSGDMLLAAAIAWGDVSWRAADKDVGGQLEVSFAKLNTGSPVISRWREILRGAPLQAPLPPRSTHASASYPIRPVRIYEESPNGVMRETDPIAPLWVQ